MLVLAEQQARSSAETRAEYGRAGTRNFDNERDDAGQRQPENQDLAPDSERIRDRDDRPNNVKRLPGQLPPKRERRPGCGHRPCSRLNAA